MESFFFAYCPLAYDGDFYPEAPPGCSLTPLFSASPGLLLCQCHITDQLQLDAEFEAVKPYLVGERLHRLLHSGLRWPPALALARLRSTDWEEEHLSLDAFEERMNQLLHQCLDRQNRIPAQFLPARANLADLNRGEYYWVLQGTPESKWVRWVSADFRLCEGPPDLFHWPAALRSKERDPQGSPRSPKAPTGAPVASSDREGIAEHASS